MRDSEARHWDLAAYLSIRRRRDALLWPLSRWLADRGATPLAVSLSGAAWAAIACWALSWRAWLSLVAFLAALICDALDGALARHVGSSRPSGKLIDHACDTATFLLVILAIARCHLAPPLPLALAAVIPAPLLAIAVLARRGRRLDREAELSGGFLGHFYKVPVYAAFLLYCAGVADLLDPAVRLADATALTSLLLVLTLALLGPADSKHRGATATDSPR
jgi:phosphatidylglycerophosphate synthase